MSTLQFGKIADEPIDVYHGNDAVGKTRLDVFRDSPALYFKRFISKVIPRSEPSDALIVGSAVDALSLEGAGSYADKFAVEPAGEDVPKRPTKAQLASLKPTPAALESISYWSSFDRAAKGKMIVSAKQDELARKCSAALLANPVFAQFMQSGQSQVTFRVQGDKFALQCRPDRWLEEGCALTDGAPVIVDVKTIAELPANDPEHLPRHIAQFGYHRAAYLYREVVAEVMKYKDGYRPPFVLVFVEKQEPFAVVARVVDETALEVAAKEVAEALDRLRTCYATNTWPESWDAPMAKVGVPGWYAKRAGVEGAGW